MVRSRMPLALAAAAGLAFLLVASLPAEEVNIAPTGTATQSSTDFGGLPERGIDGNTSGLWGDGSLTHTDGSMPAWWQVDLGQTYEIRRIVLWNRADCCAERLSNFSVSILDDGGQEVWSDPFFTEPPPAETYPPGPSFEIDLGGSTSGQTVRVELLGPAGTGGTTYLSLAEVQVFVDSATIPLTITQQPRSGRVYAGKPFSFTVGILDPTGVTLQWKKGPTALAGETAATLAFCKVKASDAGTYTVTATRGAESVTSDPATLEVVEGNLAPSGMASQSTTGFGGEASRAIDGNTSGVYGENSVSHTADGDLAPWWELELLGDSTIETIILWNRANECDPILCSSRLSNFRVSILDRDQQEVHGEDFYTDGLGYPDTTTAGLEVAVPASTVGRFVRVDILGPNSFWGESMWLSLAEVEVFGTGPTAPPDPNLARGRSATQSSTHGAPYPAALALDGNLATFSHTLTDDAAATWEVDLCGETDIEEIVLHNRADCCASRLRDITVSILDAARTSVFDSDLLNPENEEGGGQPGVGPATLGVNLKDLVGTAVKGRYVRVVRTADPDLSGSAGQGSGGAFPVDEANVLSLAEVEVFGPVTCPPQGDTHCTGLTVEGPTDGSPGVYTLTASGTDDSGDIVLYYTFTLDDGVNPPTVIGPQRKNSATVFLRLGMWTATVLVDDSTRCPDEAANATCSKVIDATGDPDNLALQGTATQSSTANDAPASRAIDGITDGNFFGGSVTHTDPADVAPWWQVDLGGSFPLERIVLWNRTDCCPDRLSNFRVSVLDADLAEVWGQDLFTDLTYPDTSVEGYEILVPAGTMGQVVRIDLLGPSASSMTLISLAEVQVFRSSGGEPNRFRRGEANADGTLNITDGIYILNYLFLGGPTPPCLEAANANDDATVNITDGIFVLNYLFLGGPAPPAPGPSDCGPDPAGSQSDDGCLAYSNC